MQHEVFDDLGVERAASGAGNCRETGRPPGGPVHHRVARQVGVAASCERFGVDRNGRHQLLVRHRRDGLGDVVAHLVGRRAARHRALRHCADDLGGARCGGHGLRRLSDLGGIAGNLRRLQRLARLNDLDRAQPHRCQRAGERAEPIGGHHGQALRRVGELPSGWVEDVAFDVALLLCLLAALGHRVADLPRGALEQVLADVVFGASRLVGAVCRNLSGGLAHRS